MPSSNIGTLAGKRKRIRVRMNKRRDKNFKPSAGSPVFIVTGKRKARKMKRRR